MKRFLATTLSATFLAGLVIGCNPPSGTTEKSSHSGMIEKDTGKGMHTGPSGKEKEPDSTKK